MIDKLKNMIYRFIYGEERIIPSNRLFRIEGWRYNPDAFRR